MHAIPAKLIRGLMVVSLVLPFALVGCTTTREITETRNRNTDYVVGATYVLMQPVFEKSGALFQLGYDGTPRTLSEFQVARPHYPVLEAGKELKVTRIEIVRSPEMGALTKVYGTPGGESEVDLTWISRHVYAATFTGVDLKFLKPLKSASTPSQ